MAFSPDGRTLIWGGLNRKELVLWEVVTGQVRARLAGHQADLRCVAFSPNGLMMASGSADASALIWDATGQRDRQQSPASLSAGQLDKLWNDLAARDAAVAYQAICMLRASPRHCLQLLKEQMKPVPHADAKRLAEALRNLDSAQFTARNEATKELEKLGETAELALRQALTEKPSLEMRQRVEKLLDQIGEAHQLRQGRTLEVLEQIGDPASRRLLMALAEGAPLARLTLEAKASLQRLEQRDATSP